MEYFLKCNNKATVMQNFVQCRFFCGIKMWNAIIEYYLLYFLSQQLLKDCPEQVFFEAIATISRKVILWNGFWFTLYFSVKGVHHVVTYPFLSLIMMTRQVRTGPCETMLTVEIRFILMFSQTFSKLMIKAPGNCFLYLHQRVYIFTKRSFLNLTVL